MARARKAKKRNVVVVRRSKQNVSNKEMSLLGKALRALGTAGGAAIGTAFGAPMTGAAAGNSLGASISKWLGSGDYEISQNSIVHKVRSAPTVPAMHNSGQSVIVRHKEYLGQVNSSVNFTVQGVFPLNPGRDDTFPWLCTIARRFQEYAFKGVVFHYVPTSGSISTTQALGSVMMQTTYRTTDAQPVSKTEMLNEYWACEAVPYDTFAHPIECDPKENPFNVHYVRSGEVPSGESKLSYDLGTMFIATSGQSTNDTVLGDLWVTYEVELKKPVLSSDVSATALTAGRLWTGAALTSTSFFNGNLGATDGLLQVTFADRTITLPPGNYGRFYITLYVTGSTPFTGPVAWINAATLTSCTLLQFIPQALGGPVYGMSNTTATNELNLYYHLAVSKPSGDTTATIALPSFTVGGGIIGSLGVRINRTENFV